LRHVHSRTELQLELTPTCLMIEVFANIIRHSAAILIISQGVPFEFQKADTINILLILFTIAYWHTRNMFHVFS